MVLIFDENSIITNEEGNRFRPLTGIMVLIGVYEAAMYLYDKMAFPSPYGDCGSYR